VSKELRPSLLRRIGNSWRARGRKAAGIDVTRDGFAVKNRRVRMDMRWEDVTQIDCGVRDHIALDLFFATFYAGTTKVTVDELDDGFRGFENAVFDHWPNLREPWIALQCGPLHHPQFQTLWRR
jgi:hypothetical protein